LEHLDREPYPSVVYLRPESTPQLERACDAFNAERFERGETDQAGRVQHGYIYGQSIIFMDRVLVVQEVLAEHGAQAGQCAGVAHLDHRDGDAKDRGHGVDAVVFGVTQHQDRPVLDG
jgi:hypothetical protein